MRDEIEKEIQDKGLNAPRVTLDHVRSLIEDTVYFKLTEKLTICVVTLTNGFEITGECSCVSPENYDKDLSEKRALEKAMQKIFDFEAYRLKARL